MFKGLHLSESKFLFKLTAIGWIIFKLSSIKLWFIFDRQFPIISISDHFENSNALFHNGLGFLSFALLLSLIYKINKKSLALFLGIETLLLLTDVMRWQPTEYQFYISFLIYLFKPKQFKTYLILLLSATYIFSGLQKLNLRFINFIWSMSILKDFLDLPYEYAFSKPIKALGFLIPLIEILCGFFMLSKWKKYAFITVIIIHIFILIYIGPFGLNINSAVWSWNILMIAYALFFVFKSSPIRLKHNYLNTAWLILIFIMPFFNFFEKYYPYFSFELYTGSKHFLYINDQFDNNLALADTTITTHKNYYASTKVTAWSFKELNIPFPHDKWLYKRFIKSYRRDYPEASPCFEISYYPYKTKEIFSE